MMVAWGWNGEIGQDREGIKGGGTLGQRELLGGPGQASQRLGTGAGPCLRTSHHFCLSTWVQAIILSGFSILAGRTVTHCPCFLELSSSF